MDLRTEAEALLRRLTGTDATFRAGQWEAIERLVSGRASGPDGGKARSTSSPLGCFVKEDQVRRCLSHPSSL